MVYKLSKGLSLPYTNNGHFFTLVEAITTKFDRFLNLRGLKNLSRMYTKKAIQNIVKLLKISDQEKVLNVAREN